MNTLIAIYFGLIGASFGSFALVVADRLHNGKDWVRGRSACDNCNKQLTARDLVPIGSWIFAKGKCRYCGVALSASYPLTELFMGLALALSYIFWPFELGSFTSWAQFVLWIFALVLMCILFIYDLRWFKLPYKIVNPLIWLGILWGVLDMYQQGLSRGLVAEYIFGVAVGAGVFQLLYSVSKGKWIGDGDVRLGIAIGLFAGSPLEAWLVIFTASVVGLLLAFPSILKSKANRMKLRMPFGPSLLLALWFTVLFGTQIIEWYKVNILYL